jgi:pimeloyl-ACP methyl ester carboxylesterase
MKIVFFILLIGLIAFAATEKQRFHTFKCMEQNETVVLLHGLCRTSRSMVKMERALEAEGYNVINVDYPSRSATIKELTEQVFQGLEATALRHSDSGKVHFVTHSMGGVLLGRYLETHQLSNLGNVVMLAPPSRGSEVPDRLGGLKLYQWINGPAGNQVGTDSHPLRLDVPGSDIGVIAGDRSINPILSLLIPGPDDGKVSLTRVRPEGATDVIRLHVTHACMMRNRQVISQTIAFLGNGAFNKAGGTPAQTKGEIK